MTLEEVRESLGLFAEGSTWAMFRSRVNADGCLAGLVHTSYFACPAVVDAICGHIRTMQTAASEAVGEEGVAAAEPHATTIHAAEPAVTRSVRRWFEFRWARALLILVLASAVFSSANYVYRVAVLPHSLHTRALKMVRTGTQDALYADVDSVRAWVAALAALGYGGDAAAAVDKVYPSAKGFRALIELIRWSRVCSGADCAARDEWVKSLWDAVNREARATTFLSDLSEPPIKATQLDGYRYLATLLGSLKHVPQPDRGLNASFTTLDTSRFSNQIRALARIADPQTRSKLLYLSPLFDTRTPTRDMQTWDQGIEPRMGVENKIWLAAAMTCTGGQSRVREAEDKERFVPEYNRLLTEMQANFLWWGGCEDHLSWAAAALMAASLDWKQIPPQKRGAELAASFSLAAQNLLDWFTKADDPRARALREIAEETTAQAIETFLAAPSGDVTGVLRDARAVVAAVEEQGKRRSGDSFLENEMKPASRKIEARLLLTIDWRRPPVPDMVPIIEAGGEPWLRGALAKRIVEATVRSPEVPAEWDDAMYRLFGALIQTKNSLGNAYYLDQMYLGPSENSTPLHYRRYRLLVKAAASDVLSNGKAIDIDMLGNRFDFLSASEKDLISSVERASDLDVRVSSKIYRLLAMQFAYAGRHHHALTYADRASMPNDRLAAYTAILMSLDAAKRQLGAKDIDEVLDRGDAVLEDAVREWQRRNPGH